MNDIGTYFGSMTEGKFRWKGGERNNISVRKFPIFSGFFLT